MSSKTITWGVVAILAALFIYWQYSNYAHNNQLNTDLGNRNSIDARVAAASELIDKKQFGDVLPTTPEYVHYRVIDGLFRIVQETGHADRASEALKQLTGLMKDSDEGVRFKAQRNLAALGVRALGIDSAMDDGLIAALKDGDAHAKKGAVAVAAQIARQGSKQSTTTIKALVNAVKKDKDERPAAVDALVALAPAPNSQLLKLLSDKDKDVQSAAAKYFGNSKQTVGEDPLLALLQNKDVRPAAMRAEGLLGDMRALPEVEKALSDSADQGNRRTAIVALGDMHAVSAIPLIVPFLQDSDPDIQSVAVVALHSMGPAGVPALTQAYTSKDPLVRKGVAGSLQGETDPGALALLSRALHDPDVTVRQAAANSLGTLNNAGAVPALIAALRDPSPDVAETAETSLAQIGGPAVGPLVASLGSGSAPAVGTPGGTAAGDVTGSGAKVGTGTGTATAAIVVPYYASKALTLIGPQAAGAVIAAAQNGSPEARKWALVTLADLRTPAAKPVLESIARTGDPSIRWFAQDALRRYQA